MRPLTPRAVARNRARIRQLAETAPSDLEALALLWDDDAIVDDGTVVGRLWAILRATERSSIPGLQTRIIFSDTGFAGDQRVHGGKGFRDPWPSSRNQVGHFLTAVRLRFAPEIVSRPIPLLGSIRRIVGAPGAMSDAEVAARLAIGHEKATDPRTGPQAAMIVLATGLLTYQTAKDQGVGERERWRHVTAVAFAETRRQGAEILGAFRAQFNATTDGDLAAWRKALERSGPGTAFHRRAVEGRRSPLRAIRVNDGEGNSVQDLRLTLVGWRLGQLIGGGAFADRRAIAAWLRRTLG